MSTAQSPQDEIAAMQAALARHDEDLERIKQWLPESPDSVRQAIEQQAAEFAAAHERIERELNAVRERQESNEPQGLTAYGRRKGIMGADDDPQPDQHSCRGW